jgi:hypothetical protein
MLAKLAEWAITALHRPGFDINTANYASVTVASSIFGYVIEEPLHLPRKFPMISVAMQTWTTTSPTENLASGLEIIAQGLQIIHRATGSRA